MSEHDDRYASSDLPQTTAEFRATPDLSASTAEFKAFASKQDRDDNHELGGPGGVWPEQPWAGEAAKRGSRWTIAIAGAVVVVIVIIVLIVAVG